MTVAEGVDPFARELCLGTPGKWRTARLAADGSRCQLVRRRALGAYSHTNLVGDLTIP